MVLITYYYLKQSKPNNYFGIAKLPTYTNSTTAITAGILTAIDRVPSKVSFTEPSARVEDSRAHGRNVAYSDIVGYENGNLVIPDHPMKSGKWWYYVVGSCTTVSATYETHSLYEADTLPYLGVHGELEHATTAYNKSIDLLGVTLEEATLTFGQARPTSQSFRGTVAYPKAGGDLARPSALDYKGNYLPGKFSAVLEYGGTTANFKVLDGMITVSNRIEYIKSSSEYTTEVIAHSRDYEIKLKGLMSKNTLFTIPRTTISYSSNTLTFDFKTYTSTNNYVQFSFNNLRLDPHLDAEKIDEGEYVWKANIVLKNCGARTAVSRGKLEMEIVDDLTKNHYER